MSRDTIERTKPGEAVPDVRVYVGASRRSTRWTSATFAWSELVARTAAPVRQVETAAELNRQGREAKADKKDVGGYVGGVLKGARRTKGAVQWRTLLTLDADQADGDFIEHVRRAVPGAFIAHTSFSHTTKAPRWRLIVPTDRAMHLDEFAFLSRQVAEDIGAGYFDPTTHDPGRLMFWPAVPADGEFRQEVGEGDALKVDEVLAAHPGWQDMTRWRLHGEDDAAVSERAEKQADPRTKRGLVGAFCRAYDIRAAIAAFLPGVYEPAEAPGRLTYTKGTAQGGAVFYGDGAFLYSYHATDPTSETLVNAFDLVRLHKFGDLDEKAKKGTPATSLPSFREMEALAAADPNVRAELSREKADRLHDFDELADEEDGLLEPVRVRVLLETTSKGNVIESSDNLKIILARDVNLAGKIRFNDFTNRTEVTEPLPWRNRELGATWTDNDEGSFRNYLERQYGITHRGLVQDALAELRFRERFHPIREYFDRLDWDGRPRLETLFIDFLGADDTAITRAMTRKMMVAAVARVFEPGVKFDHMLVLAGAQGVGKSYLVQLLGGEYFSDSVQSMSGREAYEQLQGKHIIEFAELAAMRKTEVEQTKHFITKPSDSFRPAYGRNVIDVPRQCVFFGTTNETHFLKDVTGNRRFWIVEVRDREECRRRLFNEFDEAYRDQIWAEAVDLYRYSDETLFLNREQEAEARALQEAHREVNDKLGIVAEYLDTPLPEEWESWDITRRALYFTLEEGMREPGVRLRDRVSVVEIWTECFGQSPERMRKIDGNEIRDMMATLDSWKRYDESTTGKLRFGPYGIQRAFLRLNEKTLPGQE